MHKEHFCTTETPQKITEISRKYHGKSRKITENHGKSRKITEGFFQANHGNSRIPAAPPYTTAPPCTNTPLYTTAPPLCAIATLDTREPYLGHTDFVTILCVDHLIAFQYNAATCTRYHRRALKAPHTNPSPAVLRVDGRGINGRLMGPCLVVSWCQVSEPISPAHPAPGQVGQGGTTPQQMRHPVASPRRVRSLPQLTGWVDGWTGGWVVEWMGGSGMDGWTGM